MYRLYKYSQRICQGQESSQGLRLRQKEEYSLYLNKYIYLNKTSFEDSFALIVYIIAYII